MQCSPGWALPVVVLAGIVISVLVYKLTAKLFRFEAA